MTSTLLWSLIALQIAMGAFDTLYHHELTERLAWRPSQRHELRLHGVRNLAYAALFLTLGWLEVHGAFAIAIISVLVIEVVITLMDFVEEDMSRKLPASERINHTLLALNYGAILSLLLPTLVDWAGLRTGVHLRPHGAWSLLASVAALGVALFGLRDLLAASRCKRLVRGAAAELAQALEGRQRILVTGATGFVGKRLTAALTSAGHEVIALTRDPAKACDLGAPIGVITSLDQLPSDLRLDAIVNLAGEPIADGLWTKRKRREILHSRVSITEALVSLIARLDSKPPVLVSGSAIGWYGLRGDERLDETAPGKACFSREVCEAWERTAQKAEQHGTRVVVMRTGLVLGTDGGLLARMLTPFEFGLGGPIGEGTQFMSWIERDDLVRLVIHAIETRELSGPLNATAPEPVSNTVFTAALGMALSRPAALRAPAKLLHILGGDFADELLLGGQRVVPAKALASGFRFRHETLGSALTDILGAKRGLPLAPLRESHAAGA
jgi:uncharacterized protein (TIGR01777 family)